MSYPGISHPSRKKVRAIRSIQIAPPIVVPRPKIAVNTNTGMIIPKANIELTIPIYAVALLKTLLCSISRELMRPELAMKI